jgi:hypothetical protein
VSRTRSRSARRTALAVILAVGGLSVQALADQHLVVRLDDAAVASGPADRMTPPVVDVVSIANVGELREDVANSVIAAAEAVGARWSYARGYTLGLNAVRRGGAVVQQASGPTGVWQFPMSTTILPYGAISEIMRGPSADTVAAGQVVLNAESAAMRGARVGDVLDLIGADGGVRSFTVGHLASPAEIGGTEIVMSSEQGDQMGATRITRIVVYGVFSRSTLDAELAARNLIDGGAVRIVRSWDPQRPDDTLGLLRTKQLLGEFDYRILSDGLQVDADWTATNLVRVNYSGVAVRANCHRAIVDALQAALTEVAQAGLAWAIDVGNTNTYGGCYNPRFNRILGTELGNVSRHTWGQAIDMNTVTNAQGRVPQMDCRVVRIFRKHGFTWGGNFLLPDGMHFEYVGEPRHEYQFPSEYCPNLPNGELGLSSVTPRQRDVLFADDGWSGHGP